MRWWRTADGGRTWTELPGSELPLEGAPIGNNGPCPGDILPHLVFATAQLGWLTEAACGTGRARPVIWRTTDGGSRWTVAALPAPAGGWGQWDQNYIGGTDVGQPWLTTTPGQPGRQVLLVPVATGLSGLVIERSADGGRTWRIAATLDTRALPPVGSPDTAADWFDPVDAQRWVVAAPGGLIETADAGRTWTAVRTTLALSGQPAWFTSLSSGFVLGTGTVATVSTTNGGHTWTSEAAPGTLTSGDKTEPAITAVSVAGPRLAVAFGPGGLETSTSGGRSWIRRLGSATPVSEAEFANSQVGFAVAGDELLRSIDGGVSWRPLLEPAAGAVSAADFWSAEAGVAVVGRALLTTTDAGATWSQLRLPAGWSADPTLTAGGTIGNACFTSSGTGWVAALRDGQYGILGTADAGRHWQVALTPAALLALAPLGKNPAPLGKPPLTVQVAGCSGATAWVLVAQRVTPAMGNDQGTWALLRSLDDGTTWREVLRSADVTEQQGIYEFAPTAPASAWFVAGTSGGYVAFEEGITTDGGLHWLMRPLPAAQDADGWQQLSLAAVNASTAWVLYTATDNGRSYLDATTDAGVHWHQLAQFGW
jgi:hypothetical protein